MVTSEKMTGSKDGGLGPPRKAARPQHPTMGAQRMSFNFSLVTFEPPSKCNGVRAVMTPTIMNHRARSVTARHINLGTGDVAVVVFMAQDSAI